MSGYLTFVLSEFAIILFSIDPPSKPGRPDIVDWDKDRIDLKWPKPADDGGAPVEKYVIQKRDKGERSGWQTAMTVPGDRFVTAAVTANFLLFLVFYYFFRHVLVNRSRSFPMNSNIL
jgi:hypothetical protein